MRAANISTADNSPISGADMLITNTNTVRFGAGKHRHVTLCLHEICVSFSLLIHLKIYTMCLNTALKIVPNVHFHSVEIGSLKSDSLYSLICSYSNLLDTSN